MSRRKGVNVATGIVVALLLYGTIESVRILLAGPEGRGSALLFLTWSVAGSPYLFQWRRELLDE